MCCFLVHKTVAQWSGDCGDLALVNSLPRGWRWPLKFSKMFQYFCVRKRCVHLDRVPAETITVLEIEWFKSSFECQSKRENCIWNYAFGVRSKCIRLRIIDSEMHRIFHRRIPIHFTYSEFPQHEQRRGGEGQRQTKQYSFRLQISIWNQFAWHRRRARS